MVRQTACVFVALAAALAGTAGATEICGNDIDDDNNGMTDEGCAPALTSNVCESPLSCMETGMVSWSSGALHYDLPPDVAPKVPYGPGIGFRRFYTSMSTPGSTPTSVNKTPLGDHWQHTYLTYMDRISASKAVLHTNDGRDILAATTSTVSGWEIFVPQAGFHILSWKHNTASPNQWQVQLLTGETIVYNSVGQVTEIWDSMASPNKVLITWDSTTNGNVSTVTDAHGMRRLQFSYSNGRMTTVQFQVFNTSSWLNQHTTNFDYSPPSVTLDTTSGWYVPANATEWTNLLSGSGLANPTSLWLVQQASGSLADSIGSSPATMTGGTYQVAVSGWTRKGVKMTTDGGTGSATMATPNASTTSLLMAQIYSINTNPASGYRALGCLGSTKYEEPELVNGPKMRAQSDVNTASGTSNRSGTILVVTKLDHSRNELVVYTDAGDVLRPTFVNQAANTSSFLLGDGVSSSDATLLYATMFTGSGAELSDVQVANLMKRMKSGPGLTKVTIGSTVAQRMTYDSTGLLVKITDDPGNLIASFKYSSTVAGQTDVVATPRGTVGFEFSSSRTGCTGQTALYFNKANTTSCTTDTDCGAGAMCGGKTSSGATGTCFQAARCLTLSTSFNEAVVTNVSPIGAGGGSCSGACTDVAQYVWNTATSSVIAATGVKDPLGNFTSALYDLNGMPIQIAYGDTDSDPTNGGFQRTTYFFYDSTYPGRLAEVRRKSDLDPSASSCSSSSSTGCARTLYAYNTAGDKQLASITETGTTLDASGSTTSYSSQVNYQFDAQGRLTQVDGPVSPMKTTYSYWALTTDVSWQKRGFLSGYAAYKDATHTLTPSVFSYDLWGNPTGVTTPDGTVTCQTFDTDRGFLTQRREAMAGQTDCTTNAADLTTSWARDSALRITQLTRPDGSCMFWEYDTNGRLARTKRRDDCNAASSGDKEEYLYTDEGLLYEIDTYNSSGTITRKRLMSYYASRKLAGITNPVDITKSTNLLYDAAGMVNEVDGAGSLGKTTYSINADRRVTAETRYKDSTNSDTWQLLYDWIGNQSKVTDADSKATQTVRDDLGRIVKVVSPDMGYPTLRVYDAASRLTTVVEAFGGGTAQMTHTFTFDALSRPLVDDYAGACPTGTTHAEIIRSYDAPSDTCPAGAAKLCARTNGRLAEESATLACSPSYADGSLDQRTWYSYDDNGRPIEEYVSDDTTRVADHYYGWNKNGALSNVVTPSAFQINWSYGSASSNSDLDRITAVTTGRTGVNFVDTVKWFPYGPLQQYNWEATSGGTGLLTYFTRNLAYRATYVGNAELSSLSSALDAVTLSEDAKGRVVTRDYSPSDPTYAGLFDSYFLYDQQDRVTCETTTFQSTCPTSGAGLKNNQTAFTGAGDWTTLKRPVPGSTGFTNVFGLGTGTHQITSVNQNDGSPVLGTTAMAYDARGNRMYDDNTSTLSHDRRDYTYDARGNVVNVRGEYKTGGSWHFYDVGSDFDARNRRVEKSFYDETTLAVATWFFYYDAFDRLTEVRYTPNVSSPATYSLFQLFWLDKRIVGFWQTDYPSATTSKRYVASDESERPIKLWTWPSSGSTSVAWAINPSAWGLDNNLAGSSVLQPILFAGQVSDPETSSYEDNGTTVHRSGVAVNGYRTYDGFSGAYLQADALVDETWESYQYASSDPVGKSDPEGLMWSQSVCRAATTHTPLTGLDGEDAIGGEEIEYAECTDYATDPNGGEDHINQPHPAPPLEPPTAGGGAAPVKKPKGVPGRPCRNIYPAVGCNWLRHRNLPDPGPSGDCTMECARYSRGVQSTCMRAHGQRGKDLPLDRCVQNAQQQGTQCINHCNWCRTGGPSGWSAWQTDPKPDGDCATRDDLGAD